MLKPVSVNRAWQGRRFKTKEYKDFEEQMLWTLKGWRKRTNGNYEIHFKFHLKNAAASDLSNFIKTTEDCIVTAGIVRDDRYCWRMVIEKFRSEVDCFEFEIKDL